MSKQKSDEYHGHPMFYVILDEIRELHNRKNFQYASSEDPLGNFKRCAELTKKLINPRIKNKPLAYLLMLVSKQIDSVYDIIGEGKEGTIEEVEDKLLDMATYSVLAIILDREFRRRMKEAEEWMMTHR